MARHSHRPAMPALSPDDGDVLGYVRVSTESQAIADKSSLADQHRAIEQLAAKLGRTIAPAFMFSDPGRSGQTAEDRPGFMAMVSYCEAHPRPPRAPGFVLALNASRWGRFARPEEGAYWRIRLEKIGWRVKFVEGDDSEDVTAQTVLRSIGAAQASAYSAAVRANAKRGARSTAEQGRWQNEAPIGFRRLASRAGAPDMILEPGQRKADDQRVTLTPGPADEVALVQSIFARYASGEHSLGSLARSLNVEHPGRRWSRSTVAALLKNPAYTGAVVWGRRPHDRQERRETPVRDRSAWYGREDAHPALISREMFDRVQAQLESNRRERRSTGGGYPFSGLLTCAQCGRLYHGGGGSGGPAHDPDRYRFYRCSGATNARDACPGRVGTLMKRWVEPVIIAEIAKVVARPSIQRAIAEEVDRLFSASEEGQATDRRGLERQAQELARQRDNLIGAVARGLLSDTEAAAALASVRVKLDATTTAIEQLRFERRRTGRLTTERDQLLGLAADFAARARTLNGPALRELVRPWIEGAIVDKERRILRLAIRRVPAAGPLMALSYGPGRD